MANLPEDLTFPVETSMELARQLKACRTLLHDLHARMVDGYDGAEGSRNDLPFTGGDIRDIWEVLR